MQLPNKRSLETPADSVSKKPRPQESTKENDCIPLRRYPRTVIAWNCNGLTPRLRSESDTRQIREFIKEHNPDVMFLSEVRISAATKFVNGENGRQRKRIRSQMRDNDTQSFRDCSLVHSLMGSPELRSYKLYLSLADRKYAGTAMLHNRETTVKPKKVRYNLGRQNIKGSYHNPDGRVIYAVFDSFSILHTYSPNNGWKEESFARRRAWDESVRSFLVRKKEAGVNVVWVGDLNVAPKDEDLSHPVFFRGQRADRGSSNQKSQEPLAQEDVGRPGCTDGERNRFDAILDAADMKDAYRHLVGESLNSGFTWRGTVPGRHAGRGMRIDHCIVSRNVLSRIESVHITGHGIQRLGFLGSDHSPLVVTLTKEENDNGEVTAGR